MPKYEIRMPDGTFHRVECDLTLGRLKRDLAAMLWGSFDAFDKADEILRFLYCGQGGGLESFPNLGEPPFADEAAVKTAMQELMDSFEWVEFCNETVVVSRFRPGSNGEELGFTGVVIPSTHRLDLQETKAIHVKARAHGWEFERSWRYWCCSTDTNPLPKAVAKTINDVWGGTVRVKGYSGGYHVDGDIDSYHVDSLAGLRVLAEAIEDHVGHVRYGGER